jgi:glycosyltransferase involved in cell wall biosynthesis
MSRDGILRMMKMAKARGKNKSGGKAAAKETKDMVSVIITVKNEEKHMRNLLDSLIIQQRPWEIIIVDADSKDRTREIVKEYQKRHDNIILELYAAQRGESRNRGIQMAKGEFVAFIDGDCIANPFWLQECRKSLASCDVVGGRTITMGYEAFVELSRVELYYKGVDVTMPSCNLVYRKKIFGKVPGFDSKFVTAEDIDLNIRTLNAGYRIAYNDKAIVYHLARSTMVSFFKQAFWNGLGRKQLSRKHGRLWGKYDYSELFKNRVTFWYIVRMGVAMLGYVTLTFMPFKEYMVEKNAKAKT